MPENFDTKDNGEPTSAHKWDEQFRVKGERQGLPPPEKLRARIAQLKLVIDKTNDHHKNRGYAREIEWRKRQLLGLDDATGS